MGKPGATRYQFSLDASTPVVIYRRCRLARHRSDSATREHALLFRIALLRLFEDLGSYPAWRQRFSRRGLPMRGLFASSASEAVLAGGGGSGAPSFGNCAIALAQRPLIYQRTPFQRSIQLL